MSETLEPDASAGGAGAPPPEQSANRASAGLTREYGRPEIAVRWYASRCIHSGRCIQALPVVFDPRRRPWVDVQAADADAIARAVELCPTGALRYERHDGAPNEAAPDAVQITPVRNGPYFLRGRIEIVDPGSGERTIETRVALCRCGQSQHMPYCDNTHRATGFRSRP